jgi:hypothetical protein
MYKSQACSNIPPPPENAVADCYGFLLSVYETFQIYFFLSLWRIYLIIAFALLEP